MNVVEALIAHHTVLRTLYRQAETIPLVFEEFIHNLVVHHTMEEKYFYDLLQRFDQAEHDALEAVNEHHIIEMIIKDAEGFPNEHEHFPIKIEGLMRKRLRYFHWQRNYSALKSSIRLEICSRRPRRDCCKSPCRSCRKHSWLNLLNQ